MAGGWGQGLKIAGVLGALSGLGVALFLFGYYSGATQKVPVVVVAGDDVKFNDSKNAYERKLSVVRVPRAVKVEMADVMKLDQLVRYRNEKKTVYSSDNFATGSFWTEDLVIGFADGSEKDGVIYRCSGRSEAGVYYNFYSTFENCWGPKPSGRVARFRLLKSNPSPLHLAVYSCLTPQKTRYLSLNSRCESAEDSVQEMLGYARAATVLMSEDTAPAGPPKPAAAASR